MKRMISLLCAAVLFAGFPAGFPVSAEEAAQKCGDNITWRYDADTKTLYLEGSGDMYHYDRTGNYAPWCDQNRYRIEHLSVADGITSIGDCAFNLCNCFEELELPASVSTVGKYAFSMCLSLKQVRMPGVKNLDNYAFYTCVDLSDVELPQSLERIGDGCFIMCYNLAELHVPDTVTDIGNYLFTNCPKWYRAQTDDYVILGDGFLCKYLGSDTELVIPDTVKQIASDFLYRHDPNETQMSPELFNDSITSVTIPDGVTEIRENTFSGCVNLKEVTVPASVHSIGKNAFKDTTWLETVGDPVILGDGVLYRWQNRDKIPQIPAAVHTIVSGAFQGDKIIEIQIPPTVTEIQPGAIDCRRAVIAGEKGSAAEVYAIQNNIPFRDLYATAPQSPDLSLDYAKDGWYFGNSGEIFGDEYYLTDADRQRLTDLGISTQSVEQAWGGSCVGLALTVVLAKSGVFHPSELQAGAQTLSDVKPTDAVRSFINYYQCTQGRNGTVTGTSDFEKIYNMSLRLPHVKHGESPFLLSFACAGGGSHGVAAYDLESGTWTYNGKDYDRRVLVWDSNFPDALHDDSCLYFDSRTLDFCIPYYGVHVADGARDNTAGLIAAMNDLSVLNAYPYPLTDGRQGDLNFDGSVNIADAVLLCRHLTTENLLNDRALRLAELSGDSVVDAADLSLLKRALLR